MGNRAGKLLDRFLVDLSGVYDASAGNVWGDEISTYNDSHLVTIKVKHHAAAIQQLMDPSPTHRNSAQTQTETALVCHRNPLQLTDTLQEDDRNHRQQHQYSYHKHRAFSRRHACVSTTDAGLRGELPFDVIDATHLKRFVWLIQFFTLVFTLRIWSYLSSLRLIAVPPIQSLTSLQPVSPPPDVRANCTGWSVVPAEVGFALKPPDDQFSNGTLKDTNATAEEERARESDCFYLISEYGKENDTYELTAEPEHDINIDPDTANAILSVYMVAMVCGWLLLAAVIIFSVFKARGDNKMCFGMCDAGRLLAFLPCLRGMSGATLAGHVAQADEDAEVIVFKGKSTANGMSSRDISSDDDYDASDSSGSDRTSRRKKRNKKKNKKQKKEKGKDTLRDETIAAQIFEHQHSILLRFRLRLSSEVATQYIVVEPEKNTERKLRPKNPLFGDKSSGNNNDNDSDDNDFNRSPSPPYSPGGDGEGTEELPPDPYAPSDYKSEQRGKALTLLALCLSLANVIMAFVDWYCYLAQPNSPRFNGFFWVSFLLGFIASVAVPWYLYQRWLKRRWEFASRAEGSSPYQHLLYNYFDGK